MVISSKWITRTSLSATVTRVSNFVEENMCVVCFYIVKAPHPGGDDDDELEFNDASTLLGH